MSIAQYHGTADDASTDDVAVAQTCHGPLGIDANPQLGVGGVDTERLLVRMWGCEVGPGNGSRLFCGAFWRACATEEERKRRDCGYPRDPLARRWQGQSPKQLQQHVHGRYRIVREQSRY